MDIFESNLPIIVSYPRYSGGKFLINTLSLSKHAVPQNLEVVEHLLTQGDDYECRFNSILTTLPPPNEMKQWVEKFEFGDRQIYGDDLTHWYNGQKLLTNNIVERLVNKNLSFFITNHNEDDKLHKLLSVWSNSSIILLVNHCKFSTISHRLKSNNYDSLSDHAGNYSRHRYQKISGKDWPSWEEFESVGYNINKLEKYQNVSGEISKFYCWQDIKNKVFLFDVDGSIFDQQKFVLAARWLYDQFEFDDFNEELVIKFWQEYMKIHLDTK